MGKLLQNVMREALRQGRIAFPKGEGASNDSQVERIYRKNFPEGPSFKDKVRSLAEDNFLNREEMNDALDPVNESKWKNFIDYEYKRVAKPIKNPETVEEKKEALFDIGIDASDMRKSKALELYDQNFPAISEPSSIPAPSISPTPEKASPRAYEELAKKIKAPIAKSTSKPSSLPISNITPGEKALPSQSAAPTITQKMQDAYIENVRKGTPGITEKRLQEMRKLVPVNHTERAISPSPRTMKDPASSLLQTIQSIQSNPVQLQKERQRAVSVHSRRSSVDQNWNKREEPFTGPDIEKSEVRIPKERTGFIDPNMRLSSVGDSASVNHGAVYTQQADKGILEAALKVASKPIQHYGGQTIAELEDLENRARDMALHENPYFNEDTLDTEEQIREHLEQGGSMPGASDVANPYLKSMTQSPAEMYEQILGPQERAQLASIREESDRNLYEKLLPELKRKYMVPGMKRSGHQNKEVRDLIRDYSKGRQHAIDQAATSNRLGAFGVSQKHADTLGNVASQSSANQQKDTLREFDAARLKNASLQDRSNVRKAHRDEINKLGLQDRGITQQKLNEDLKKFTDEQSHQKNQLLFASSLTNHTPMQVTGAVNALPVNPALDGPNSSHVLSGGLSGLGAGQISRQHAKKGGTIKARPRYADGGQIMKEAISNAVIDKDDPLTALRRLMNRQRMMDVSETKIGKRRYRDGGQVNPIQAGANKAREFLGEKDLRAHIESQKTPYQKPMITSMADDFMRGMASVGGTNGLATMAKGYHAVAQNKDAEHQRAHEQKHKAFEDIYKLDQDAKKSEADLRKEAFEERKYHADEKYRRDELAQTGEYQRGMIANKNLKEKKLTRADQETLSATTKSITAAPDLLDDLAEMRELSARLKTGTLRNQLVSSESPYWLAKAGVGDQADIDRYIKLSNGLATKASAVFGARAGANIVKLFKQEKPNIDMTPAAIQKIIDKMEFQVQRAVERGYYVQDEMEKGVSPSKAVSDFDKKLKIERDKQAAAKVKDEAKKHLGPRPLAPAVVTYKPMDNNNYLGAPDPIRTAVPTKKEPVYLGSAQTNSAQPAEAPYLGSAQTNSAQPAEAPEEENVWGTPGATLDNSEEENVWGTPGATLDNSELIDNSALTNTSAALESLNAKKARLAQLESGRR